MPNLANKNRTIEATMTETTALGSLTGNETLPGEFIPGIDLSNYIDPATNSGDYQKTGIKGKFTQTIWNKITDILTFALSKIEGNSTSAKALNKLSSGLIYQENTSKFVSLANNPNPNESYDLVNPHPSNYRRALYSKEDMKAILIKVIHRTGKIGFSGLNTIAASATTVNDTINYDPSASGSGIITTDQKFTSYNSAVGYVSHRFKVDIVKGHDYVKLAIETYTFLGSAYTFFVPEFSTDSSYSAVAPLKEVTFGVSANNDFNTIFVTHSPSLTWLPNETVKSLYYQVRVKGDFGNNYRGGWSVDWTTMYKPNGSNPLDFIDTINSLTV